MVKPPNTYRSKRLPDKKREYRAVKGKEIRCPVCESANGYVKHTSSEYVCRRCGNISQIDIPQSNGAKHGDGTKKS